MLGQSQSPTPWANVIGQRGDGHEDRANQSPSFDIGESCQRAPFLTEDAAVGRRECEVSGGQPSSPASKRESVLELVFAKTKMEILRDIPESSQLQEPIALPCA
jgi:hypothetical protein